MSNNEHFSLFEDGKSQKMALVGEVTILMLKGAAYAAVFCLVAWFSIVGLSAIGGLLPAESQEAADPTPWSALDIETPETVV